MLWLEHWASGNECLRPRTFLGGVHTSPAPLGHHVQNSLLSKLQSPESDSENPTGPSWQFIGGQQQLQSWYPEGHSPELPELHWLAAEPGLRLSADTWETHTGN